MKVKSPKRKSRTPKRKIIANVTIPPGAVVTIHAGKFNRVDVFGTLVGSDGSMGEVLIDEITIHEGATVCSALGHNGFNKITLDANALTPTAVRRGRSG